MTLHISQELGAELAVKAQKMGVSPETYLRQLLERELASSLAKQPLRSSYGVLAKYGPAPSEAQINQNRAEMFQNFARGDE